MMSDSVIHLKNVKFRWPGEDKDILDISSLEIKRGEHLFIRGPSGTGKSTLLNLLAGIHLASSGNVEILGQNLAAISHGARDRFRADHLGVIFQQFNLLPYLSVIENVALACRFSQRRRDKANPPVESATRLLEHLGIPPETHLKPASKLSVGQQQRVAVARALIGRPEVVLADEPTSALDTENRDRFLELLFKEAEEQGSTLVYVSHDPSLVTGGSSGRFKKVVSLTDINQAGCLQEVTESEGAIK